MSDDPLAARIGEVLAEVRFPIERGKVGEFARAIREGSAVHRDARAAADEGFAGIPAPLTFTIASVLYGSGNAADVVAKLGLDLGRMLHGGHRWVLHATPVVGDELVGVTRLTGARQRRNRADKLMRIFEITTEYSRPDGTPVVSETMTTIEMPA